jgi:protein SCO1/2
MSKAWNSIPIRWIVSAGPALVILLATGALAETSPAESRQSATIGAEAQPSSGPSSYLLPEPRKLEPFQLLDQDNRVFDRERLAGRWNLIFFGYTYCPDICPMALSILQGVFDSLKRQPNLLKDLQGIFISVDPKRDKPEILKNYVGYFNPDFLGLTGEEEQIRHLARWFGAKYSYFYSWETEGEYFIDHTATLFLVDPRGRLYAAFPVPYGPEDIVENLSSIIGSYKDPGP